MLRKGIRLDQDFIVSRCCCLRLSVRDKPLFSSQNRARQKSDNFPICRNKTQFFSSSRAARLPADQHFKVPPVLPRGKQSWSDTRHERDAAASKKGYHSAAGLVYHFAAIGWVAFAHRVEGDIEMRREQSRAFQSLGSVCL